ncbi:MAG TPA: DGQHR domain-containing protein [Gammaproteobacteria bacterium]|nr:DGQHR domain-containing protein [Gammaproteobacteria bacterium]
MEIQMKNIFIPSVKGNIGDWVYYTSVMPIRELSERVSFVKDVHKSNILSELLQRSISDKREIEISNYLAETDQRFLNSLVLAIYDTLPQWHPASIESTFVLQNTDEIQGDVGLLEFNGNEKIIPIDGQHRLAGIKYLLEKYNNKEIKRNENYPILADIIPVIFIAHRNDSEKNRLRTRRLFTTLNKYAVKVNKQEIIAIDEDDPMAITTRWLVENDKRFYDGRIKIKGGANIDINDECLTSIENLYDILTILFVKILKKGSQKTLTQMKRPSNKQLKAYRREGISFFDCLANYSPEIKDFFDSSSYGEIAQNYRQKGHVLFRPVGLKLIANLLSKIDGQLLEERFDRLKNLPMNLNLLPFRGLLITKHGKMQDSNEAKARNLLLASIGISLNVTEVNSAKAGIAIITGHNKNKIKNSHIPTTINDLKKIDKIKVN